MLLMGPSVGIIKKREGKSEQLDNQEDSYVMMVSR